MHDDTYKWIILFGILFICIFLITRVIVKGSKEIKHYDEMQEQYRCKAYKIGFITFLCALTIVIVLHGLFGDYIDKYVSQQFVYLVILFVGFGTFAIYSIVKNAFFRVNEKKGPYLMLCFTVLFGNATAVFSSIREKRFMDDGRLGVTNGGASLIILCCFSVILITILVKVARDRKVEVE